MVNGCGPRRRDTWELGQMIIDLVVPAKESDGRVYLSWTPVQATIRLLSGPGPGQTVRVTLRNAGTVGEVWFDLVRSHTGKPTLQIDLPGDGSPIRFWLAGAFQKPSEDFGDAVIEIVETQTSAVLNTTPVMVRVRKDVEALTAAERDRFLSAFGTLNGQGTGRFSQFRDMHTRVSAAQAHGEQGFLPWHRAYLLDLERELQAVDARVTLPYWRFDRPAPKLFTPDFIGLPNRSGTVQFVPGHPFQAWTTDGTLGISRTMLFQAANAPAGLRTEQQTIAFGAGIFDQFSKIAFLSNGNVAPARSGIEINPHGDAHTSFAGYISSVPTAAKDPLFFLLHANVDRLWAKWQWFYKRTSDADQNAYPQGGGKPPGHNVGDTMWPWNGVTSPADPTRPPTAPGGSLALSVLTSAPGPSPTVRSLIDYQGVHGGPHLAFDYDDVPFELPPAIV
jgi:tyrosinase